MSTLAPHDARQRLIGIAQYCATGYVAGDYLVVLLRSLAPGLDGRPREEVTANFAILVEVVDRLARTAEGSRRHRSIGRLLDQTLALMVPEVTA